MGGDLTHVVRDALLSGLRGDAAIRDAAHVIDDGMLNRPPYPHLQWIDAKSSAWGAKDRPGGEVTAVLVLRDKGQTGRILPLAQAMARVAEGLPRVIDGWETSGVVLMARSHGWTKTGVEEIRLSIRVRGWRVA